MSNKFSEIKFIEDNLQIKYDKNIFMMIGFSLLRKISSSVLRFFQLQICCCKKLFNHKPILSCKNDCKSYIKYTRKSIRDLSIHLRYLLKMQN